MVEIDYCPQCRGVWLDRGELDKIIDRAIDSEIAAENGGRAAAPAVPAAPPAPRPVQAQPAAGYPAQPQYGDRRYEERRYDDRRQDGHRYDDDRRHDHYDPRYDKKKRKESFLGDLFDF
ncbi:zf-TFIIB domain-containing protein [Myceligenerans crystallogenes]|uniref:Zf-TFIIB domain-containing protein n=1 Tax=Myceligenerans crystallogenes TaxID=316335 RepID=A0ABN2NI01_9MICO